MYAGDRLDVCSRNSFVVLEMHGLRRESSRVISDISLLRRRLSPEIKAARWNIDGGAVLTAKFKAFV